MPKHPRRRLVRALGLAGVALVVLAFGGFGLAYAIWGWSRVPTYAPAAPLPSAEFLSWDGHNAVYRSHEGPYILRLNSAAGEALYIGAFHTQDPDDAQIDRIITLWDEFDPTVALCESRLGLYIGGLRGGVGMFGEAGAVYVLARANDVPIYSLEPAYEDEVAALLEEFPPEHVALYFTMRVFWQESRGRSSESLDGLVMHLARKRTNVEGLRDVITSVADIDAIWSRDFADLPDWRAAATSDRSAYEVYEDTDTAGGTILRAIADADREIRGRHMVRTIADLMNNGERVFAVVGRSHVIRQAPLLRAALGEENVMLERSSSRQEKAAEHSEIE